MMTWHPISEAELWNRINRDWDKMSLEQRRFWEVAKVPPQKWQQHPWGDEGGGFWVVAVLGQWVVWYNDIEDGFNRSQYTAHGVIRDYWCNQDKLGWTLQYLLDEIRDGYSSGGFFGPPMPVD
ncbi:MAG: hypothetical protein ACYC3X_31440 [Pirellulaceae bacterium]